jgi:formylglycine-generating enzyme required for sulfatase activity
MRCVQWILFVAMSALLIAAPAAHADKRVALVVGNSAYRYTPELANPRNDAADMAAVLGKHGFEVIIGIDLDKAAFDRKVGEFVVTLKGADAGVFFYAGHGLQVAGRNYLVPIDAKAEEAALVDLEMVQVDTLHAIMERQTETNVLFLDACRDNPLARNLARSMGTRSAEVGRGLAEIKAGVGTLISFSTQPGNVALDGAGRNSPYTGALVERLKAPKDDLSAILIDVRNDVMRATRNKQVPWEHVALRARFYFTAPAAPGPVPAPQAGEAAERAWALAKDSDDLRTLDVFRKQYGAANPFYDRLAEARIQRLKLDTKGKERERLALLQKQQEEERRRAEEKRQAEGAAWRDPALSVRPGSGESFRDSLAAGRPCPECPEMVVVPAGEFTMGSPPGEDGRDHDEGPQHPVTIARAFAVGKFEVTRVELETFVRESGRAVGDKCFTYEGRQWQERAGRSFRNPGIVQDDRHPAVCVSWEDASAFVDWLSRKTGKTYRLLTEAEWEYAARAGTTTPFWWGSSISTKEANYNGEYAYGGGNKGEYREKTVPVDSFAANPWGLYNVHGNVGEWVQDCWNDSYNSAPADGSVRTTGDCGRRVMRGGSSLNGPRFLRSADRDGFAPDNRINAVGFRVGRTLSARAGAITIAPGAH